MGRWVSCRKPLSPEPDGPLGGTRWLLLVPTAGLEPAAYGLGNRRSVHLSYAGRSLRGGAVGGLVGSRFGPHCRGCHWTPASRPSAFGSATGPAPAAQAPPQLPSRVRGSSQRSPRRRFLAREEPTSRIRFVVGTCVRRGTVVRCLMSRVVTYARRRESAGRCGC